MEYLEAIKNKGLKNTPARRLVYELVEKAPTPIAVDEIWQQIKELKEGIDRVTIYRTVDSLVSKDLLTRVNFMDGKDRYEVKSEHHHHLVCEKCGKISPIMGECVAVSDKAIKEKYGFLVNRHSLEFFGKCQECD